LPLRRRAIDVARRRRFDLRFDFMGAALTRLLVVVLALLAFAPGAQAARVALVMGNGAYAQGNTLTNPPVDAEAVAAFLTTAGFSVTTVVDAPGAGMAEALTAFGEALKPDDEVVFYYAGHGVQVGGENWLVGVDARLKSAAEVAKQAIALNDVIGAIEGKVRLAMIFIDACRNNPFAASLGEGPQARGGLAAVEPQGDGVMIAFAAAPGRVAYDGAGEHSPFTVALLDHLDDAGAPVDVAFKRVIREVRDATNNRQSPQFVSSLSTEFFFGDTVAPVLSEDQASLDYERAERIGSIRGWHLYLEKYPEGFLSDMANEALQQAMKALWNEESGIEPADAEEQLKLTKQARLEVQLALSDLGYDLGVPDGAIGPKSRRAISALQRTAGLFETGYLGFSTLAELGIPFVSSQTNTAMSGKAQVYRVADLEGLETDQRLLSGIACLPGKFVSYGFYEGHLYMIVDGASDLAEAQAAAARCGGYMATITSAGENAFIANLWRSDPRFYENTPTPDGQPYTAGPAFGLVQGQGSEPAGGWHWLNGEPVTYTNWAQNEPNDYEDNEDAARFGGPGLATSTWNDTFPGVGNYVIEIN
jgi:peptidoglycan hydrolase-like protein with peptidoglycan-binding domain